MRDPHIEHLRFLHGDECVPTKVAELGDLEIIRNDIDRLDNKMSQVTQVLQELLTEIKKLNTL
tara:strand:+ start:11161 stop:11349 length:189 start_codon:yes stop_codon:yes gene_type:complete